MHSFYLSYLLRIWELDHHDPQQFLASLEKPGTRELINFRDIEELFDFLRIQIRNTHPSNLSNFKIGTED